MADASTLIIGAGLTGLSCAWHLGGDYLLIEKEGEPGGIVRTRDCHNGFLCDGTGHWLHLRNPRMKELVGQLLPDQMVEHERKAVIHSHGVFTPYPFQANTHGLPAQVVLDCLLGLLKARFPNEFGATAAPAPANFKEWIGRVFGEGIARHFMIPYNEKLLGVGLEELRPEYAERFIPRPSLEDVVKGALGFSRESLGYNAKFAYPREGGISALPRAFAKRLAVAPTYHTTVTAVDLRTRTATLSNGRQVGYRRLVNTMPLPKFIAMLQGVPDEITAAARKLRATTVHYFDIGVRGPGAAASQYHWIYFPEPEYLFYRSGSYSAVHAGAAPAGCRSYYVEMSGGAQSLLGKPEQLRERVLHDLRKAHVLSDQDEILFMELREIPFAYVIFDHNYEKCRKALLDYLMGQDIFTAGRWGGWGYGGMEDAMLDGLAAAQWAGAGVGKSVAVSAA
jgi:protoporphyrinogen oxidase